VAGCCECDAGVLDTINVGSKFTGLRNFTICIRHKLLSGGLNEGR